MKDKDKRLLIAHVEVDYLPINDVFRQLCSNPSKVSNPEKIDILLKELIDFLQDKRLTLIKGPEMKSVESIDASIEKIRRKWIAEKYEDVNYMYWIDFQEMND